MRTRRHRLIFSGIFSGLVACALLVAMDAQEPRRQFSSQCTFNDECAPGLICAGGLCRAQCRTARDCPRGDECQTLVIDAEERPLRKLAPDEAVSSLSQEVMREPGHYLRARCVPAGFQAPKSAAAPAPPAVIAPPIIKPGTPVAPDRSQPTIEPDTSRFGNEYKSFETKDGPDACAADCSIDGRCRSWTWAKPGVRSKVALCSLNDGVPAAKKDPCCASGVKR